MRRLAIVLPVLVAGLGLAGCSSDGGPLLRGWSEGSACTGSDGRPAYVATQYIQNHTGSAVTLTGVAPADSVNSRARQVLIGPEVPTSLIGGADTARNLDELHPFTPYELAPKQTVTVAFISTVRNRNADAAVKGVRVRYRLDGQEYSGTIPWTYTFAHARCPR